MFSPIFSSHIFCFTIFVVFVALPSSKGADNWHKECSKLLFSCGNLTNVGYPFWGDGRPRECGDPDLQLQCINDLGNHTFLKIGPNQLVPYNLRSMKISDRNITLQLVGAPDTPCSFYGKDVGDVLKFSGSVEKINVVYDCSTGIVGPNTTDGPPITCYQNSTQVTAYYRRNMSAYDEFATCKSAEVPVLRKEMDIYLKGKGNFSEVIHKGFEVNYEFSAHCIKCQKSKCLCGSTPSCEFACLCKPGKLKAVHAIAIASSGAFILGALIVCLCCYKKCNPRPPVMLSKMISTYFTASDLETGTSIHGIPVFSYRELQEATGNFDASKELGDGGFGIVYYGKLRDGREVAVKRLYEKSYKQVGQFMNEVEILTCLRHPNLVTLYGSTSRHSKDLLLVYEYVSNGTVADHIHGDRSRSGQLTWAIRMKIAVETASALSYLHTSDIVHRDVKTTNILLDNNFTVKVADFGLSRLFPYDVTHLSTAPQGTPGYLDPEYHKCYQVTNKSDVYSFGVVLVELISSLPAVDIRRNEDEINLADYAMKRIQKAVLHELVDQKLGYNSDFKVKRMMTLVAELAFQCLQQEKEVRPFMTEVLDTLMKIKHLDYEALETDEMEDRQILVVNDDIKKPPSSPSSVIDNWAMKSNKTNSITST